MGDEKDRVRSRREFDYRVMCFKVFDADGNQKPPVVITVKVLDISYSGIGIECNVKLTSGDVLMLNITHKREMTLEFASEVKWCKLNKDIYSAGLAFKDLTKEHIFLLHSIIG